MNRNASRDNDISEDFEQLVGNKGGQDASDGSPSINVQDMNQQQMRQQMMQQQHAQQQAQQQSESDKNNEPVRVSVVPETKENFSFSDPTKILTAVCVLFALFFVFSSSQLTNGLNGVAFIRNLPFAEQSNLVIRGLLFVTIYMLLDRFVL